MLINLIRLNAQIRALHAVWGFSYEGIQARMQEATGVANRADLTPGLIRAAELEFQRWLDECEEAKAQADAEPFFDEEKLWEAHCDYLAFLRDGGQPPEAF